MFGHQGSIEKYDTIVIGSGISGLTIALILAKEGQKVALFERDQDIAPLIRPYQRKGCGCCPGFHVSGWVEEGEVISTFFKYLNVADGVTKELHETGISDVFIGPDKYHIPRGFDNVEKSLLSYFPENAEAVSNYIRLVKEVNEQSFYFNHRLAPNMNDGREFLGTDNYSLEGRLQQYHASRRLIDVLGILNNFIIGSKADEVPFAAHAFALGGFFQSPGHFTISGIHNLLANFKRELARFSVDLFLHAEVEEILTGLNRNVIGVKISDGAQYFSNNTIASFHPKLLNEKLKPNILRPIYRRRLDEAENTFGMFVAFYQIADDKDIEIENFVYYNENLDITLGMTSNRSGDERVICGFLEDDHKDFPASLEERKCQTTEKLVLLENTIYEKLPGLRGKLVLLDFLKPWSFERYTKTANGSAYGIKHTVNSIGFQHKVPIHGLYLVGQAIFPGVLGSMLSSFSLACQLLDVDKFWPRVINQ